MRESFILYAPDTAAFTPALVLGQGYPKTIGGQPVSYQWKEMLLPGTYFDGRGVRFTVDESRIDNLIKNTKRFAPAQILSRHISPGEEKDAKDTFGYVIDYRKNARGALEGLHQLIGDDAIKAAARNGTSIYTIKNATDEHGNKFDEVIDHNAVIPNPRLTGLANFEPAIAASRGAAQAVVLTLAASTENTTMPLIDDIKKALGTPDLADDKLAARIGELVKAEGDLKLSRTAHEADKTLLATAQTELSTATKSLELARKQPDADVLADRADIYDSKVDMLVEKGLATPAQATELKKVIRVGDKPNALMLSRTGAGAYPWEPFLKVLEMGSNKLPGRTEADPTNLALARTIPGDENTDKAAKDTEKAIAEQTAKAMESRYGWVTPATTPATKPV